MNKSMVNLVLRRDILLMHPMMKKEIMLVHTPGRTSPLQRRRTPRLAGVTSAVIGALWIA